MAKGYEARMTTILSAKGSIEIPEAFRKADALEAGQRIEIERVGHGEYRVRASGLASRSEPEGSLVDVLLSCPVKDFFTPMERAETTDDLKPVGFE
jgi:bifunctional DNA-binding transcriptional regulator/antitoxin component of YhaV-PrlF toxin-antitoxin module